MESRLFDLTGRTALVTGAGRGIGPALAKGFARQGADVALAARTAILLASRAGDFITGQISYVDGGWTALI